LSSWLRLTRIASIIALAVSLVPVPTAGAQSGQRLSVIASFYPLQELAQRIGGERISVTNLVPPGAEPHDLELTPRDMERLRQANLLLFIGNGFQPGLEKGMQAVGSLSLLTIDATQGMQLLPGLAEEEQHASGHGHGADEGTPLDPHVWLDPLLMRDVAARVRDALIAIDPAGRDQFEANARALQAQYEDLDQAFRQGLQSCQRRQIVTSHAAFGYLARRYGLEQIPILGLAPDAEPSPARMQEIARFARSQNVKVIYFETLVDSRLSETIAREVGATTLVLNPIEGLTSDEQARGVGYLDLMRQNLANLRMGLDCA
jgi:zinc transport system substrate-binding protein